MNDVALVKLGKRASDLWEWLGSAPGVTEQHVDDAISQAFEFGFWDCDGCGFPYAEEISIEVDE